MSTVTATSAAATTAAAPGVVTGKSADETADRFLKLLVTQLQNQDPLNPLDNAELTSQMAQISTVSGLEKLNGTIESLGGQMMQMRILQATSLVGREVVLEGNVLAPGDGEGPMSGHFDLGSDASRVEVEILDAGGRVIDTLELEDLDEGRHAFEWAPSNDAERSTAEGFRIQAFAGESPVPSRTLVIDRVESVSAAGDGLSVELASFGVVPYAQVIETR
jgi:flagellar basal-body rod modification protein FlgD